MTEVLNKRIRLIYGILLTVSILVAGFCLMTACIGIYRSGEKPFSREAVAAAFQGISIFIYFCLALIAGSFVLELFLPPIKTKQGGQPPLAMLLHRLHSRIDLSQSGPTLIKDVRKLQNTRRLHQIITLALLGIGCVVFLVYALDGSHFHTQQINRSMINAMAVALPCVTVPAVYAVVAGFLAHRSMAQEISLLRDYGVARSQPQEEKAICVAPQRILRWTLLVIAAAFTVYGLLAGGTLDVLTKAVNICTECVGLG